AFPTCNRLFCSGTVRNRVANELNWAKAIASNWSQQENPLKLESPWWRATHFLNSFSGRCWISCEKTVRPEFIHHCFTLQDSGRKSIRPFSIQIVLASTMRYHADLQWVRMASRTFSRTVVIRIKLLPFTGLVYHWFSNSAGVRRKG